MKELIARGIIDKINNVSDSYTCKLSYLTGARANEICALGNAEKNTKPVGPTKQDVGYDSYEGVEVLKILIRVLKRKEDKGIPLRTVALPLNDYEPWAKDLANWIEKLGVNDPLLPIRRQSLNGILRSYGLYEAALSLEENVNLGIVDNPLRHLRIHDLFEYYKLDPLEVVAYTGHKISSAFRVSDALAKYAHLRWTQYFPKLLKPLPREVII